MFYIYCYTNKINGHAYVGQTNYIARRQSEHKYAAFTASSPEYNFLFHKKLREYGLENFDFAILEELDTDDTTYVDEREAYWIEVKHSFVKDSGYNLTRGGQNAGRHKALNTETIGLIINYLENSDYTYNEIYQITGVSLKTLIAINKGIGIGLPKRQYPIRPLHAIGEETKDFIKELLITTDYTQKVIANLANVSVSTVKRIKYNLTHSN